jgi:hypothetical protein
VYDYKGAYLDDGVNKGVGIKSRHDINAQAEIYTFGPKRIKTPEF